MSHNTAIASLFEELFKLRRIYSTFNTVNPYLYLRLLIIFQKETPDKK